VGELHAGASQISPLRQTYSIPADFGYVAGGSLLFKTFSHTVQGSLSRQMGDSYGLGAANSLTGNASWHWYRPGNSWSLQAIFSWQKLNQGSSVEDWSVTGAATRELSTHVSLQIAYLYLQFSQLHLPGVLPPQSSVRASVSWSPQEMHP
jgi:hypothetical protein